MPFVDVNDKRFRTLIVDGHMVLTGKLADDDETIYVCEPMFGLIIAKNGERQDGLRPYTGLDRFVRIEMTDDDRAKVEDKIAELTVEIRKHTQELTITGGDMHSLINSANSENLTQLSQEIDQYLMSITRNSRGIKQIMLEIKHLRNIIDNSAYFEWLFWW